MQHVKYILFFLVSAVSLTNCGSEEEPLFILQTEADFIIQPGLNTFDTHYFVIRDVPTRIGNYFSGSIGPSDIGRMLPNRAELNAQFNNIDWALVAEVSIWMVSQSDPDLRKEVFYNDRIQFNDVNELRLLSSLSEVKDILLEDRVTIEVRLNFRRTTPIEIESRLTMNFVANGPIQ